MHIQITFGLALSKRSQKINYFNIATNPIDEKAHPILSEGHGLWDTGKIMFSLRKDLHGRLIIGSMGSIIKGMANLSERWAIRNLRRLYPDLTDITIESAWHGNIAMTPNHLFRIHRLAENLTHQSVIMGVELPREQCLERR